MKEAQRSPETRRPSDREEKRGNGVRASSQRSRLPAHQIARLLSRQESLLEAPESFLEELAQGVGNSNLADLLGQGGLRPPVLQREDLPWESQEEKVNEISAAPPRLIPFPGWPERTGSRPSPARPHRLRERGA